MYFCQKNGVERVKLKFNWKARNYNLNYNEKQEKINLKLLSIIKLLI